MARSVVNAQIRWLGDRILGFAIARRNYRLENQPPGGILNLDILCNQSLIQVVNKT